MNDKEIKQVLLNMLIEFDDYCNKHNLKYVLDFGTLLGAIRHHGFIPWDDDVDVSMPRTDYDRLIELQKTNPLNDRYKLECIELNNSPYPFIKMIDSKTKIINSKSSLHTSLWIDIFPIDGMRRTDKERNKDYKKKERYAFLLENACCQLGSGKTFLKKIVKFFVILYSKIKGPYYYGNKIRNIALSDNYDNANYVCMVVWGNFNVKNFLTKEQYFDLIRVDFEGHMFNAPKEYDLHLRNTYGDYMKLPPENQRVNHGTKAEYID